jgi:hypothetical protein
MKNRNLVTVITIVAISLLAFFAGKCSHPTNEVYSVTKTDTVIVNRQYTDTVVIHHFNKPKTITIYKLADTVRRKAMEQRTLIQGIRIEPKGVEVATIDTGGFTKVAFYPIPLCASVAIADTGAVEVTPMSKRKANLRKAGNVALIVLAFVAGFALR